MSGRGTKARIACPGCACWTRLQKQRTSMAAPSRRSSLITTDRASGLIPDSHKLTQMDSVCRNKEKGALKGERASRQHTASKQRRQRQASEKGGVTTQVPRRHVTQSRPP